MTEEAARAESLRQAGDPSAARAVALEALESARDGVARGKLLLVLGRSLLDLSETAEAEKTLEKAAKLVAPAPALQAEVELDLAQVRRRARDLEGALRSLAQAAERFRVAGSTGGERRALALRAEILSLAGDLPGARAALRAALALEGLEPPAWKLHRALANAYAREGRAVEAEHAGRLAREGGSDGDAGDEPASGLRALIESARPDPDVPISDPGPARAGEDADALARSIEGLSRADCVRLVALAGTLCAEITPQALLELILDRALAWTGAQRGYVALSKGLELDGSMRIETHAARAAGGRRLQEPEDEVARVFVREAVEKGDAFATDDAAREARLRGVAGPTGQPARAAAAAPLKIRRATLGALYLEGPGRSVAFGPRERALLEALASYAAVALERSLKAEKLEEDWRETRRAIVESGEVAFALTARAPAMKNLLRLVARVSAHEAPVLVEGETGTGKELVARAIHASSRRRAGPFVAENLGSLPETLIETEFFGSVKGAFTGAEDRRGAFERANGGTLFLDDVDEASPRVQALLLRALETSEVRPVGAPSARKVDCRVIASSRRNLLELTRTGAFREDLYFRLNVMRLVVPPLRERAEDVPALVETFLRELGRPLSALTPQALDALLAHPWPGNVRELRHALERACVVAGSQPIDAAHLGLGDASQAPGRPAVPPLASATRLAVGSHSVSRRQVVLVEYLREHGVATTRDYMELASVSAATAWRDLNDLLEKRLIRAEGHGRSTVYKLPIAAP